MCVCVLTLHMRYICIVYIYIYTRVPTPPHTPGSLPFSRSSSVVFTGAIKAGKFASGSFVGRAPSETVERPVQVGLSLSHTHTQPLRRRRDDRCAGRTVIRPGPGPGAGPGPTGPGPVGGRSGAPATRRGRARLTRRLPARPTAALAIPRRAL